MVSYHVLFLHEKDTPIRRLFWEIVCYTHSSCGDARHTISTVQLRPLMRKAGKGRQMTPAREGGKKQNVVEPEMRVKMRMREVHLPFSPLLGGFVRLGAS